MKKLFLLIALIATRLSLSATTIYKLEKVNSVAAGEKYVFIQSGHAMDGVIDNYAIQTTTGYQTKGLNGTESYVWTLESADGGFYLKNCKEKENKNKYLGHSSSSTNIKGLQGNAADATIWNLSFNDSIVTIGSTSEKRILAFMGVDQYAYKAYSSSTSNPRTIYAYKLVEQMHKITWNVDGQAYTEGVPTSQVGNDQKVTTLPTNPTPCHSQIAFVGWSAATITGKQTTPPTDLFTTAAEAPTVTADAEYHAVWATKKLTAEEAKEATIYSSNITYSTTNGVKASSITISINSSNYSGMKLGTGSESGSFNFTIPAGTQIITLHAAGWNNGGKRSIQITTTTPDVSITPAEINLTENAGISGNGSSFTITPNNATEFFTISLTGVTKETTITATTNKNAVIWGINAVQGLYKDYATTCETPQSVTIAFDANSRCTLARESITKEVGDTILLPTVKNVETGYTFLGWSTDASTTDDYLEAGTAVTLTEDQTYYAIFASNSLVLADNVDNSNMLTTYNGQTKDVTIQRTLYSGSYNTFCVPFTIDAATLKQVFGEGQYKIMRLNTAQLTNDGQTIDLNFTQNYNIQPGVPYLIQINTTVENPQFANVVLNNEINSKSTSYIDFIGTFSPVDLTSSGAENKSCLFLGDENKLYWIAAGSSNIKGFRAYFRLKDGAPSKVAPRIHFEEESVTGFNEISYDNQHATKIIENGRIYIIHNGIRYDAVGARVK